MRVNELLGVAKVLARLVDVLLEEILGERDRLGNVLPEQLCGVFELVVDLADRVGVARLAVLVVVVVVVVSAAATLVGLAHVTGCAAMHGLALLATTAARAVLLLLLLRALSLLLQVSKHEQEGLHGHVQRDETQHKVEDELLVHEVVEEDGAIDAEQIRGHIAPQVVELQASGRAFVLDRRRRWSLDQL